MFKRYWGETIGLSPQNPGEYWGVSPCCPCGVGAYASAFPLYPSTSFLILPIYSITPCSSTSAAPPHFSLTICQQPNLLWKPQTPLATLGHSYANIITR